MGRSAVLGIAGLLVPLGVALASPSQATPSQECPSIAQTAAECSCPSAHGAACNQGSSAVLPVSGSVPAIV